MQKFFVFLFVAMIAAVLAAPSPQAEEEATCSPWLGLCYTSSDCCRHLQCSSYQAKCVPEAGLIIPGRDKRPFGPPPYAPGRSPAEVDFQ